MTNRLVLWQWRNNLKPGSDFNADDNILFLEPEVNDMTPVEVDAAIKAYTEPKVTALYINAMQNGKDILEQGNSLRAVAEAFFDHVRRGGFPVPDSVIADFALVVQRQADLEVRIAAAIRELAPPV